MSEEKTECGCVDSCLHKPNCVFQTPATREIATLRAELASARKALDHVESEARRYADMYEPHSDGRNTFVIFADMVAKLLLSDENGK
jgi:hypothetical protein